MSEATPVKERWYGIQVEGKEVTIVGIEFASASSTKGLVFEDTEIPVPPVAGPEAYKKFFDVFTAKAKNDGITHIAIRASKAFTMSEAILKAAEVRGVTMMAAYTVAPGHVHMVDPSSLASKNGAQKMADLKADKAFWAAKLNKVVRKDSMEAALTVITARNK